MADDVETWRRRIDEIDTSIVRLVNARAAAIVELARVSPDGIPELAELPTANPGPVDGGSIERIMAEIRGLTIVVAGGAFGAERAARRRSR